MFVYIRTILGKLIIFNIREKLVHKTCEDVVNFTSDVGSCFGSVIVNATL